MASVSNLLAVVFLGGCILLTVLASGERQWRAKNTNCTPPQNITTSASVPSCTNDVLGQGGIQITSKASNCCKRYPQSPDILSVACCTVDSNNFANCPTGFTDLNCLCKQMPSKGKPTCNNAFYYGTADVSSDMPVVGQCCKPKDPKPIQCCQMTENASGNLVCPVKYSPC